MLQVDLVNKLGPFAWLAAAVAFAETLVCVKVIMLGPSQLKTLLQHISQARLMFARPLTSHL